MTDPYLDHVLIGVRDLDAAAAAYSERLGFKVTPEGAHPGRGTHNRLIVFGPEYLELIAIRDGSRPPFRRSLAPFLEEREGLFIFALGTKDIDAAVARLRNAGGAVEDAVAGERKGGAGEPGYSWRFAEVADDVLPGSQTFLIQHDQTVDERYTQPPQPRIHPNGSLGVHRLVLAVRDAEEAASSWQRLFGLRRILHGDEQTGAPCVRLDLASCYLDFQSDAAAGPLGDFLERYGEAPYLLTLRVSDLEATRTDLEDRGVPTVSTDAGAFVNPRHTNGVPMELAQTPG